MANGITLFRIVFSLVLIFFSPKSITFSVFYVLCGISDVLDGFVARKTQTESQRGAILDSVADIVFLLIAACKIIPLMVLPLWAMIWIALIAVLRIGNIFIGSFSKGKWIFLHTAANKVTGCLLFSAFVTANYISIDIVAGVVCAVATFATIQEGWYILQK